MDQSKLRPIMTDLSYNVCVIPAFESAFVNNYPSNSKDLNDQMTAILHAVKDSPGALFDVPGCPGFAVSGNGIGRSYCIKLLRTIDKHGDPLIRNLTLETYFFAIDGDDVEEVCNQSLDKLNENKPIVKAHPEFTINMMNRLRPPFMSTILASDSFCGKVEEAASHEAIHLAADEFITALFSAALKEAGFEATRSGNAGSHLSQHTISIRAIACAVQTNGHEDGYLYVRRGKDGYPQIYAFIPDADFHVVCVDFDRDVMRIDTERLSHIKMDSDFLEALEYIRKEASSIHSDLDFINDEIEEFGLNFFGADPFQEFYADDDPNIYVPDELAAEIRSNLGLSLYWPLEADKAGV